MGQALMRLTLLRWMLTPVLLGAGALGVSGCSEGGDSRRIIAEACVRDGGSPDACACLGRESVDRLDADGLDAIVFGALGASEDADEVIAAMDDAAKVRFRAGVDAVLRACPAPPPAAVPAPAS